MIDTPGILGVFDSQVMNVPFATPLYDCAVQLRYEILRKPLGLEFFVEDIIEESDQYHFVFIGEQSMQVIGTLVLKALPENGQIKMRQLAVLGECQGRGIGSRLVASCECWAKERGYDRIELHARETAVPFYERLGYKVIGPRFKEVGLSHFRMYKILVSEDI